MSAVKGSSVQSGASNILDSSYFVKEDVVEVIVIANDGAEDLAPFSASITISNTAPEEPLISVTADPVEQIDDVICSGRCFF